jgi:hypothetical protein
MGWLNRNLRVWSLKLPIFNQESPQMRLYADFKIEITALQQFLHCHYMKYNSGIVVRNYLYNEHRKGDND